MNIDEILNLVDDMIETAWSVPLSGGKCVVDVEQLGALIDDIRLNLPMEIKHAKAIVADRAQIVANAKKESEEIINKAEERAKALVDNNEITKKANAKSEEILTAARTQSIQMKKAAAEYVDRVIGSTEDVLSNTLNEVRTVKKEFKGKNKNVN